MDSDLITTKEVARRKGVTVKTVNLWAQQGRLPVAEVVPIFNARLFDPAVVDAFDPKASQSAPAAPQLGVEPAPTDPPVGGGASSLPAA